MRNAAAHFDDDFAIEVPSRKKARRASSPRSPGKKKKKGKGRFSLAFDMHKVARYAAIGMGATVAVGIMVNALVMQKGRHPAPLFASTTETAVEPPHPAARSAPPKAAPEKAASEKIEPAKAAPAPREQTRAETSRPEASDKPDMIGRLIQGGSVPADRSDQKAVLDAQRALAKLGFAVKPTGTFGPQTKKALERFEKDHHLPVKGELSRRTIKALAAASGLKIEH